MRVLVTGGAGFIGSHLVDGLQTLGHEVIVLDNLSTGDRGNLPKASIEVVDVRDRGTLGKVFSASKPEVTFHLAAQMNVRKSLNDPVMDAEINILGSLNVIRAAFRHNCRRIVFASSGGAIYGNQPQYPCLESDPPSPLSPYGVAKLAVEHYGRQQALDNKAEFVGLRFSNIYGPRQNPRAEAGVVSLFVREISAGRAPVIFGDGRQTRDFLWVGDCVDGLIKAMNGSCGIFNIGSGVETSILELSEILKSLMSFQGLNEHKPGIPGEVQRNVLLIDRARDVLGWKPSVTLQEGLRRTVEALRIQV